MQLSKRSKSSALIFKSGKPKLSLNAKTVSILAISKRLPFKQAR